MGKSNDYVIGLDIGTTSVGYAVSDLSGKLIRFKKKNMWGARLFDEGQTAEKRRVFRSTRRRYERRKQRVSLLQEMFADEMGKVDPHFFLRLKESFLWKEDRSLSNLHILFDDADFNDRDYYKKYKHIYALRDALMKSREKEDLRLIYLALHHIVKYRGNFLYEGQTFSNNAGNIKISVGNLLQAADDFYETSYGTSQNIEDVCKILGNNAKSKKEKEEELKKIFIGDKDIKDSFIQITKAVLGYQADFSKIFSLSEEKKYAFAKTDIDEMDISLADDRAAVLFEAMFALYSAITLESILMGKSNISLGMIARYKKHSEDLRRLKSLVRQEFPDKYKELFSGKAYGGRRNKKNRGAVKAEKPQMNYAVYSQHYINDSNANENLCKNIANILNAKNKQLAGVNEDYDYCINEIEKSDFLKLLNTKENGAIPYQLHEKELLAIIDGQAKFYPFLEALREKIQMLVTFRIPYYVGPLNGIPEKSKSFAWAERKVLNKKVYPWNFDEVIDREASAEKFITRMTNKCTYLPQEDVIPKNSLLYSEYEVLSELNKIRVNNKLIKDTDLKAKMLEELFSNPKRAKVSEKDLINWLRKQKYPLGERVTVEGFQKEGEFASYQKALADFKKIFGVVDDSNREMIENIILWITLFEDKSISIKKIQQIYGNEISPEQIKQIKKLKYKGWSRLSRRLLTGITYIDPHQEKQTIMNFLHATNLNLMQIINDKTYGFDKIIEKAAIEKLSNTNPEEMVGGLATSPAVKKAVNQTLKVVAELAKVNGKPPKKIFLEFARNNEVPQRSKSRFNKLSNIFKEWNAQTDNKMIIKELNDNNRRLDKNAFYLYFIQNGKCMYTGEPLDILSLSMYEVDHIIPRSYIKDDSIDNLALVKKIENQTKGDNLLLNRQIIERQKPRWNLLLEKGLISQTKYKNLTRLTFDENDIKGFVKRQLVETRQIIKNVAQLLSQLYPKTQIEAVRASLSSNIRKQYGLPKIREINDYHHAFDAYLASLSGTFINTCYPNWEEMLDYNAYKKYAADRKFAEKQKNGYFAGKFSEVRYDSDTGEIIWNGEEILDYLRKAYGYKDCFISKKLEEGTGEFYNQNLVFKDAKQPMKSCLNVEKYGGYKGVNNAYSMVLSYKKKCKANKKLVGIPAYVASLSKENPEAIDTYLKQNGYEGYSVLRDKIRKYQLLEYRGQNYYLASDREIQNACQMILPVNMQKSMYEILADKCEDTQIDNNLTEIFDVLQQKIAIFYHGYASIAEKLSENRNNFLSLEKAEKIKIIKEMLKITKANAETANLTIIGMATEQGRKSKQSLSVDDIIFIDTSVTGLFERRTKL